MYALLRNVAAFLASTALSSTGWASCSGIPNCDPSVDAKVLPYALSTVYAVIEKLDLASFDNSIGPRRQEGKHTFKDYGFTLVQSDKDKAIIREPDGSWEFAVTLLTSSESTKICLEDKALNGGNYHTQHAYALTPTEDGLLHALLTENSACPSFAK